MAESYEQPRLWVTRTQAAQIVSLSTRAFDESVSPRLTTESRKGKGRGLRYDAAAVVAALVAYRLEQATPAPSADADPLLAGVDSPGLERYRLAKAELTEMDVKQRRGELVPREELAIGLAHFGGILRRAGETLQRRYGNDAAAILNEAVDEAVTGWERIYAGDADVDAKADAGGPATPGGERADAAPADHARVRRGGDRRPRRSIQGAKVPL